MKTERKLARAYLRWHWRQFAVLSVCAAVFLAAIFSLQMFFMAYNDWSEEQIRQEYGHWDAAWLDVDPGEAQTWTPPAQRVGAAYTTGYVQTDRASVPQRPCVGYWTGEAQYLINAQLISGALPQNPGEAAVAEDAGYILNIPMEIGTSFTIPVTDAAGNTAQRTYTLTGVLSAYRGQWSGIIQQGQTQAAFDQPNVITAASQEPVITVHVLMQGPESSQTHFTDAQYFVNYYTSRGYLDVTNQQILLWAVSGVLIALFIVLTVIGIRHAVRTTFQDQQQMIQMLRCVGAPRRLVMRMLMLEGGVLSLCTVAVGLVLGMMLFGATAAVLNSFTYALRYHLYLLPFVTTGVLGSAVILITNALFLRKAFRGAPLAPAASSGKRRKKRAAPSAGRRTFIQVWRRATAPSQCGQDWIVRVTAGACMALLLFAPCYADIAIDATYSYDDLEQSKTGMDYWFGLRNGGSAAATLYQEMPRYKGLMADAYRELEQNPYLSVDFAGITHMSSASILYIPGEQQPESVRKIAQRDSFVKRSDPEQQRKFLTQYGYPGDRDLLMYPVVGIPYPHMEQMGDSLRSGVLDRAAFEEGAQVAAYGSDFRLGDTLTLSIAVFPAAPTEQEKEAGLFYGIPAVTYRKVTVGAVYDGGDSFVARRLQGSVRSCLILSADLMQQLDPGAGYDDVCLSLACDPNDGAAMESVHNALDRAQAMSFMTFYRDFTGLNQLKSDVALEVRLPYIALVAVFAVTIFIALLIAMNLRVKSCAHSLLLMRAVGLDRKKLSRLLLWSTVLPCLEGAAGGILLGGGIGMFLAVTNGLAAQGILLRTLLPNLTAGLALLLIMAVISYFQPRRWILSRPVIDGVENPRF